MVSSVPRGGFILLLINAVLVTCGFGLLLAAFAHTDWAHSDYLFSPLAPSLADRVFIGPWRQCAIFSSDDHAPILPENCSDPSMIDGKLQAFRSFLVIGLFLNFIAMILAWIRFASYASGKVLQRGLDVALIVLYTSLVVSLAIVCGLSPYILDDIKGEVQAQTGGIYSAAYGDSFKIFLASFAVSIVIMLSQIIGFIVTLGRSHHHATAYPNKAQAYDTGVVTAPSTTTAYATPGDSRV